jgi:predicted RNA-binding protein with PUA-like domain
MTASYWLIKSEPMKYSWDRFVRDGSTCWDGVRNPEARNNLRAMRKADLALFYHSGEGKAVVGVAQIAREAYPDPTAGEERWVAVDVKPLTPLAQPVSLAEIRADSELSGIQLVRRPRLSVVPLTKTEFVRILRLGKTRLPAR